MDRPLEVTAERVAFPVLLLRVYDDRWNRRARWQLTERQENVVVGGAGEGHVER